jgi:hypothetical protein
MKLLLDFMKNHNTTLPNDLIKLIQMYGLADQFMMEKLMEKVVLKILEVPFFNQFTNVRRYVIMYIF